MSIGLLVAGAAGAAPAPDMAWITLPGFARERLEVRQLPGFSVSLPPGTVRRADVGDYAFGQLMLTYASGVVAVVWQPYRVGEDELAWAMDLIGAGVEGRVAPTDEFAAAGVPVRSFVTGSGGLWAPISLVSCGRREVMLATIGPDEGEARALHRRIVASVRCTPDPVQEEAAAAPPPVRVEVPRGWEPSEVDPGQVGWEGDEGEVVFQYVGFDVAEEPFRRAVDALLHLLGKGGIDSSEDVGGRTLLVGHLTLEGEAAGAVALVVPCNGRRALGLYVGDTSLPLARAVLFSARCE